MIGNPNISGEQFNGVLSVGGAAGRVVSRGVSKPLADLNGFLWQREGAKSGQSLDHAVVPAKPRIRKVTPA